MLYYSFYDNDNNADDHTYFNIITFKTVLNMCSCITRKIIFNGTYVRRSAFNKKENPVLHTNINGVMSNCRKDKNHLT